MYIVYTSWNHTYTVQANKKKKKRKKKTEAILRTTTYANSFLAKPGFVVWSGFSLFAI